MAELKKSTAAEFKEAVKNNQVVLVDFYADWCGPCRALAPTLAQVAEDYAGKATVVKVNVDENGPLAAEYKVRSIPQMFILKNGEIVESLVGNQPQKSITDKLDAHLS